VDFEDLYRAEHAKLWRSVFAFAQDRAVTDDAVAEAFAQCLRRRDAVRDPRAWVWRAAFKIASGELHARLRSVEPVLDTAAALPDGTGDLFDALRRLPERQRATLVLRHYAGYPTDEIARILGSSRATVRVHMSRGRRRLRELLQEDQDE
jgi:RNA polymerase sigma-70 factor, ECF subfamily